MTLDHNGIEAGVRCGARLGGARSRRKAHAAGGTGGLPASAFLPDRSTRGQATRATRWDTERSQATRNPLQLSI